MFNFKGALKSKNAEFRNVSEKNNILQYCIQDVKNEFVRTQTHRSTHKIMARALLVLTCLGRRTFYLLAKKYMGNDLNYQTTVGFRV